VPLEKIRVIKCLAQLYVDRLFYLVGSDIRTSDFVVTASLPATLYAGNKR
jgi:hypothetical protein